MTPPPIPVDDPRAPKYWRYETGGELAAAVTRYLHRPRDLSAYDVALIAAYVQQWIDSPAWEANPHANEEGRARLAELRIRARHIKTIADLHRWFASAISEGMDPL